MNIGVKKVLEKYNMFIKYILVAGISFLIDITLFNIFNNLLLNKIIIATILARIISSFINYLLNRNRVFKSTESKRNTFLKYYLLVVIQMLVSALVVNNLYKIIKINATIIKIPVEFTLFVCNYLIQKILIFKRGNKNEIPSK